MNYVRLDIFGFKLWVSYPTYLRLTSFLAGTAVGIVYGALIVAFNH